MEWELTAAQEAVILAEGSLFVRGPAGAGKTTALAGKLVDLLLRGAGAERILLLVAEPSRQDIFWSALQEAGVGVRSELKVVTYARWGQEMVNLFWPLVAAEAGFAQPEQSPTMLNYDLAQLLMWELLAPMLDNEIWHQLRLRPQQIVSQLLDILNRAALNGMSLEAAHARHVASWSGEPERLIQLEWAQKGVAAFRARCYEQNLLDLSLTTAVFQEHILPHEAFQSYFTEQFQHLLVDNSEELPPVGQQFVYQLGPRLETLVINYDDKGGYKRFLGADPASAANLITICEQEVVLVPLVNTVALEHVGNQVQNFLEHTTLPTAEAEGAIWATVTGRYRREMVVEVADLLGTMLAEYEIEAEEIVILAPYLDGALRYMLGQQLGQRGIPYHFDRRRQSPREEPRVRAWLTWLALAQRERVVAVSRYDVAEALALSIEGLDPVRAALISEGGYDEAEGRLLPVATWSEQLVARVGVLAGEQVERIRVWLAAQGEEMLYPELFLPKFFHEVWTRPPLRQTDVDEAGAAVCGWLVKIAEHLREAGRALGWETAETLTAKLMTGVYQGLVVANPPDLGEGGEDGGITIATVYSYLLSEQTTRVQVWLEVGAGGWWDIPRQPLSNAFVLAPSWPAEGLWTAEEEFTIRHELLSRIIQGLTNRCRDGLIIAHSGLDRRGGRQEGVLWRALAPIWPETAIIIEE
ncbi:MAG TPA: hypothetical protein VLL52_01225 [Anaerolineae bacterium]|nr:hypothetical protein [Anaerolineae bacterium]